MNHYVYPMLKHILAIKDHWFDKEKFKKFKQIAADQTWSLPLFANLRKNVLLEWDEFKRLSQVYSFVSIRN